MLEDVRPLVQAGFAVHLLKPRSKAPAEAKWSSVPRSSYAQLRAAYDGENNVGLRLGEPSRVGSLYAYLLDLDIRQIQYADQARAALREILPEYASLPTVISGSGGESRHFHFLSDDIFASRKLAHSETSFIDAEGKKHWSWEIELFGTGKQAVLPPSIHPDTGKRYRWERPFDLEMVEMGLGPVLAAARVGAWAPKKAAAFDEDDEDDLIGLVRLAPMDLTMDQIKSTLADLPLADWCEDRDGWYKVGMALHHQFEGSDEGFALWCEFSKQSDKFEEKTQKQVWKSFKPKPDGIRFATLIQAAADERLRRDLVEFEAGDDEDDLDEIIGPAPKNDADPDKPTVEWVSLLDRNEEGAIKATLPNVRLIVENDPRTAPLMQFNAFTNEIVLRGTPGRKKMKKPGPKGCRQLDGPIWEVRDPVNGDLWTDTHDRAIRDMIEAPTRQGGYGIKITDRDLVAAIDLAAKKRAFHPVREYLSGLKWDGNARVERLYIDYLGAADTPYTRSIARNFLIAAVTRVFEHGHKFDFAVILEGLQGKRKSTFIKILARHWFSELDGDFHDTKAMVESMAGSWIIEIPELSGFGRSDVRQIKAFISRTTDKVRLSYERRAALYPRQCVFNGSTNDRDYLRDDTGGRRFWPVECHVDSIDTARLEREIDQIWAEARVLYEQMRAEKPRGELPLYLTDRDAQEMASEIQESRRVETADDAMAGKIEAWLDQPVREDGFEDEAPRRRDETCLLEIGIECLGYSQANYTSNPAIAQAIGRAMKKLAPDWVQASQRRFDKWGKQRAYLRNLAPK